MANASPYQSACACLYNAIAACLVARKFATAHRPASPLGTPDVPSGPAVDPHRTPAPASGLRFIAPPSREGAAPPPSPRAEVAGVDFRW